MNAVTQPCRHQLVTEQTWREIATRPELTLGDLRQATANLPDATVVRVDAGCCLAEHLDPEHVGLAVAPAHRGARDAGNNVRIFGVSEPGEGVVWLEL